MNTIEALMTALKSGDQTVRLPLSDLLEDAGRQDEANILRKGFCISRHGELLCVKSLTIIGRRWFQKLYGKNYHSVEILVNGNQVHRIPYSYGGGQMYNQNAKRWLEENDYLPGLEKTSYGSSESLYTYCYDRGIVHVDTCTDVARKRDL